MKLNKQIISGLLRKTHFNKLVDYCKFFIDLCKNSKKNKVFLSQHSNFPAPPPYLAFDAYGHTNWKEYYKTGLKHAQLLGRIIREQVTGENIKVCEWGCGAARIIRHMPALLEFKKVELYGTDYNPETIRWCRDNIKGVEFVENQLQPPLPFESNYFDCVYNISIFTHLSEEMNYAWIKELSRITKPNGIIISTTQGDSHRHMLSEGEKKVYDSGRMVVRERTTEGKKGFATFHPPAFMKHKLLKDFEIIFHIPNRIPQDVWVIRISVNLC